MLAACAGTRPAGPADVAQLLHDEAYPAPGARLSSAADVFALSAAMRAQLAASAIPVSPSAAGRDARLRLVDLLYSRNRLALDYDASTTRTAAETFAARAGNCLSLVIMTATFARELGLPVRFNSVAVDEVWSRGNGLYFASGHVNLALGRPAAAATQTRFDRSDGDVLTIDFIPADDLRGVRSVPIGEATVVAMFMNNRAAEALARGALPEAHWYSRQALLHDSGFLPAYNTLGVTHLRSGHADWAQPAFEAVLQREPDNTKAIANLVQALRADDSAEGAGARNARADRLVERLAGIEHFAPYQHFNQGVAAMREQHFRQARDLFRQELARHPGNAETHFWLAQANHRLGNVDEALRQLELARQNSTTAGEQAIYAGKLAWLNARRAGTAADGDGRRPDAATAPQPPPF